MRWWFVPVVVLMSCHKDKDASDSGADGDADTDADADADTDGDTDQDTAPQQAQLRFVNASEAFGNADLYGEASTSPVMTIPPLSASGWQTFPPGPHEFRVGQVGETPLPEGVALDAQPVGRYTLSVVGPPEDPHFTVEEDDRNVPAGQIRYAFHNADPAIPEMDLLDLTNLMPIASDLAYPNTALVEWPSGGFDLGVDVNDDGTADWVFPVPEIPGPTYVPFFLTRQASQLVLLGASPLGQSSVVAPTSFPDTADTGGGGDTSDTGGLPADTSDTGGTPDTSDTGP